MSDETIKPVAYGDPQAFRNFAERGRLGGVYGREWMWAKPDDGLEPLYPQSTIDALRAEVDGWKGQHARDSAELRSLCAARDEWRERATRAEAEAAALREALADLLSWLPDKPSPSEWRLESGPNGADDAIEAARAAIDAARAKEGA